MTHSDLTGRKGFVKNDKDWYIIYPHILKQKITDAYLVNMLEYMIIDKLMGVTHYRIIDFTQINVFQLLNHEDTWFYEGYSNGHRLSAGNITESLGNALAYIYKSMIPNANHARILKQKLLLEKD